MKFILHSTLFVLLLASQGVGAGAYYDLKVKNPDVLPRFVFVGSGCSFSADEARDVVEGVIVRSRIKPVSFFEADPSEYYLDISVSCMPVKVGGVMKGYAAKINVDLSSTMVFNGRSGTRVSRSTDHGGLILGPSDYILESVKEYTEGFMTEYIKENYDM